MTITVKGVNQYGTQVTGVLPSPPVPVTPDVLTKKRTLVIWTKDSSSEVYAALSSVIRAQQVRFSAIDCTVSTDLEKFPVADVVLALGSAPLKQLQEAGVGIPKNRTLSSLRSLPHTVGKTEVFFSYSVAVQQVDHSWFVDLLCDFSNVITYAATGTVKPKMGAYKWIDDFAEVIADIEARFAITGKPVDVSLDTETQGTDPFHPAGRLTMIQFSTAPGNGYGLYVSSPEHATALQQPGSPVSEQLRWLLTTPKVSLKAANGKYDMVWIWVKFGIHCTNFRFDTTLVGSMLDENRSNSLDVHANLYTSIPGYSAEFDATIDKSNMAVLPKDQKLLDYGCGDTDATLQSALAMKAELLQDAGATRFYVNVLHPGARAFEVIEKGGIFIDHDAYNELESDLNTELSRLVVEVTKVIGGRIYAKHRDDTKAGGLNVTKASLIKDFMFSPMGLNLKPKMTTEKSGEPATSWEHLQHFAKIPEAALFIQLQDEYSSAAKALGTYVVGNRKHIRSDGKFHPRYFMFKGKFDDDEEGGTTTGRLSAKEPAIQTWPKKTTWGKRLRRLLIAPPGFLILERDYSQGELRVVACIANVAKMLEAYAQNKDLHVLTGSFIVGMTYEAVMALKESDNDKYELIRQPAKPANFGLLYGQGTDGFQAYAKTNYGVDLPWDEADRIRTVFFQLYVELISYHRQYKEFAHKHGFVVSPLGRKRHLPLINSKQRFIQGEWERKAINAPVQSTLSDMLVWALGIEYEMGYMEEAPSFASIHDASYDYLPEDHYLEWARKKRDIMENLPFEKVGWKPQLKFVADCKVGKNLADLKLVKFKD